MANPLHAWRLGLALLALVASQRVGAGCSPPPNALPGGYRIAEPVTCQNLTIFLIHGPDRLKGRTFLTLGEALAQKKVIVHETKNVNELAVENVSATDEVFIQAGDIVKGGQQDRVLAFDLIVPAQSGRVPIAAFCVEAGRWTRRGAESAARFGVSNNQAATKDLKLAVRKEMAQGKVWRNVDQAQQRLGANVGKSVKAAQSATSLQLSLEDKDVQAALDAYLKQLSPAIKDKDDVVGFAFAVNGKVNSAEVFASPALFRKAWPLLLKGSAVEALAEKKNGQCRQPAATVAAVRAFLMQAEKGKTAQREVAPRVTLIRQETKSTILFETRDRGNQAVPVRRSYIAY